jgi:hypothetical protein
VRSCVGVERQRGECVWCVVGVRLEIGNLGTWELDGVGQTKMDLPSYQVGADIVLLLCVCVCVCVCVWTYPCVR